MKLSEVANISQAPKPTKVDSAEQWFKTHYITKVALNPTTRRYDIDADCILALIDEQLPYPIGVVSGDCSIGSSLITTTENFPTEVHENFLLQCPRLTTLKGIPTVKQSIALTGMNLQTFEGLQPRINGSLTLTHVGVPGGDWSMLHQTLKYVEQLTFHDTVVKSNFMGVCLIPGIQYMRIGNKSMNPKAAELIEAYFETLIDERDPFELQDKLEQAGFDELARI